MKALSSASISGNRISDVSTQVVQNRLASTDWRSNERLSSQKRYRSSQDDIRGSKSRPGVELEGCGNQDL